MITVRTIQELRAECSNGFFYLLNNSGVCFTETDDLKRHSLKIFLAKSHYLIEPREQIDRRQIAVGLYLSLAIKSTHYFQDLFITSN